MRYDPREDDNPVRYAARELKRMKKAKDRRKSKRDHRDEAPPYRRGKF
jgi:hypothetical protein